MKIRIYGTGCARCRQLFDNVRAALDASGIDAEIEKVTDIGAIASSGVMATPALEVDGRIVATGAVPSAAAIAKLLPTEEAACSCCSCGGRSASEKACTAEEGGDGKGGCSCSRGGSPGRRLLGYLLVTLALVALAAAFVREAGVDDGTPRHAQDAVAEAPQAATVYYFHGNMRCATCNRFERLVREVVEERYAREIAEGRLRLEVVNLDEPGNGHFVQDFGLTARGVVLAGSRGHRSLDGIWDALARGDAAFKSYVGDGIREMLEAAE